ncbi:hypothetical protein H257_11189 [Aphanomyces astaci]|uniref:Uncharacterized protein n=1 Tax=Aphanomyces astaci TaxID=112090 RepID=W4G3I9_APHAT|nr:hypothetical protein H257_11189 [Aphanomyces astaci]ETV74255.1 hypothetical protein H257_11189 [Aphanomyces astaci]|eukprot:XP_009836361.1 hypothetical protein H257_11189 [Aphanomyces astaci]
MKKSAFRLHHCWLILKDAPKWSVAMEPQEAGSEPASVTLAPVSAMASDIRGMRVSKSTKAGCRSGLNQIKKWILAHGTPDMFTSIGSIDLTVFTVSNHRYPFHSEGCCDVCVFWQHKWTIYGKCVFALWLDFGPCVGTIRAL